MTPSETATLLAMAAAYDQRTVGQADVQAWHAVLGTLDPVEARDAIIEHYRTNRDRIMPADVYTRVKALRAARANQPVPAPPNPDDTRDYQRELQASVRAVASGQPIPHNELIAVRPPQAILDRPERRAQYQVIPCPWCNAGIGAPCEGPNGPLKTHPAHPSRVEALAAMESDAASA